MSASESMGGSAHRVDRSGGVGRVRRELPSLALVLVVCLLVGLANVGIGLLMRDAWSGGTDARPRPVPQPTPNSAPMPPSVDKKTLIIEQNYNCWLAIPGATCGPERTFL